MREQDIIDIGSIIKHEHIVSPESLSDELDKYGFKDIDISILLEGFSEAYGIDWLEKYFINKENEINNLYRKL